MWQVTGLVGVPRTCDGESVEIEHPVTKTYDAGRIPGADQIGDDLRQQSNEFFADIEEYTSERGCTYGDATWFQIISVDFIP